MTALTSGPYNEKHRWSPDGSALPSYQGGEDIDRNDNWDFYLIEPRAAPYAAS